MSPRNANEPLTALPAPERRIYCNRTLNMRSIAAVGFDMDYTLIHYKTEFWERRAYEYARGRLNDRGWPVASLEFDPRLVSLGLILDLELGNVVKANRFGYIKRAAHGTQLLPFDKQRETYSRVLVDLRERRWVFLNTLFGLSEACLYCQLVDKLDRNEIHEVLGYAGLYDVVRSSVDETHMEGALKNEIIASPDQFIELDSELPLTLLDLKNAGKKLLLITNSEWSYTRAMMSYAFDRFLGGATWRDLFHLVIVAARKPAFFTQSNPIFEVVDETGLLRPTIGKLREGGTYLGGSATAVEKHLGIVGEEILYVGDHVFADVNVSKNLLRWRTALVVRELEHDLASLTRFEQAQQSLNEMMGRKEVLEHNYSLLRIQLQRLERGYGPAPTQSQEKLRAGIQAFRSELVELDQKIAPLARQAGELVNERWGLLMRAGSDKSHFARQVERYADVYTSRVSNFLLQTPFVYLRSPGGSLPHDGGLTDPHQALSG